MKKIQITRFINTELRSDSNSNSSGLDSEKVGSKSDNQLMAKLQSDPDNDSE